MASRSRKSKGGVVGGLATIFVIGACIIGFFGIPADPNVRDLPEMLKSKSATVEAWMENCAPNAIKFDFSRCSLSSNVQPGSGSETPGTGTPTPVDSGVAETARNDLNALTKTEEQKVSYDREEWNHWVSQGSGCWDTRDKVLYDEAVKDATLVLVDKKGNTVTDVGQACAVQSGTWNDPYSGRVYTNPKELDIDHMIPLKYAATHGGQSWDENRKQQYANDLGYTNHLIAVNAGDNRSKSDRGPSQWKPSNQAYHCTYAVDWVTISKNYGLSVSPSDAQALTEMLATCG